MLKQAHLLESVGLLGSPPGRPLRDLGHRRGRPGPDLPSRKPGQGHLVFRGSLFCLYKCLRFYRVQNTETPPRKGWIWIRYSSVAAKGTPGSQSQKVMLSKPIRGETSGSRTT